MKAWMSLCVVVVGALGSVAFANPVLVYDFKADLKSDLVVNWKGGAGLMCGYSVEVWRHLDQKGRVPRMVETFEGFPRGIIG